MIGQSLPTLAPHAPRLLRSVLKREVRSMLEFAREEIIVPDGELAGTPFDPDWHPFDRQFFEVCGDPWWKEIWVTGCRQSGKTLRSLVIPALYHLCELQESIMILAPKTELANQLWKTKIKPALAKTRYADLAPTTGQGSKGGKADVLHLANGTSVYFFGAGGDPPGSFTARVVFVTEVNKMEGGSESSDEPDAIRAVKECAQSFGRMRAYFDCITTTEGGLVWHNMAVRGTSSAVMLKCPECGALQEPVRDGFVGWKDEPDVIAAEEGVAYRCAECAILWDEDLRRRAIDAGGIEDAIDPKDGRPLDEPRRTNIYSLRWNAMSIHQPIRSMGDLAAKEWEADQSESEADEEALCIYDWTRPYVPKNLHQFNLTEDRIKDSAVAMPRYMIPAGFEVITAGLDMQMEEIFYHVSAWDTEGRRHVLTYGVVEVYLQDDPQQAQSAALRRFAREQLPDMLGGEKIKQAFIDQGGGYGQRKKMSFAQVVYPFCRDMGSGTWKPCKGFAASAYSPPAKKTKEVRWIGDEMHLKYMKEHRASLAQINVDHWKGWVHDRFHVQAGRPGSVTLFAADGKKGHFRYAKHITAEERREQFDDIKGRTVIWKPIRANNHWLDASVYDAAAAHFVGVSLTPKKKRNPLAEKLLSGSGREEADVEDGWKIGR